MPRKKIRRKPVTEKFSPRIRKMRGEPRKVMVRIGDDGKEDIRIVESDLRKSRPRRKRR